MTLKIELIDHSGCIEFLAFGKAYDEDGYAPILDSVKDQLNLGHTKLIINLQNLETINSTGINALIKSFTAIRNSGGELYIVNISAKINQVLLLTKLNTVLNIATSLKNALEQLNK